MFGLGLQDIVIVLVIMILVYIFGNIHRLVRPPESKKQKHSSKHSSFKMTKTKVHDIFLSYATPDRTTAKEISKALNSLGWSVWWDRSIPPGKSFDQVIEAAIDSASCIIVLWSKSSVNSDWVKTEASEGVKRQVLVPVMIENVKIPLEFRRIQAANLIGWKSSTSHSGFQSLISSIKPLIGK